jgi:hypothetical protein
MPLKPVLGSKADIESLPEPIRALYREKDGAYVLDVEDVVPAKEVEAHRAKIAEFRDNNIKLMKELEELKSRLAKLDGVDPEEFKRLKAEKEKLVKKGVKDVDELGQFVQQSIAEATKPLVDKLTAIEQERERLKRNLEISTLKDTISSIAVKKGVKQKAIPYVIDRATQMFRVVENGDGPPKVTAKDGLYSRAKPAEPLTPEEWLDELAKSDDFLFEPSAGAGASPASGGSKSGAKQLINPTPEEMGRYAEQIAKGEVVVIRS